MTRTATTTARTTRKACIAAEDVYRASKAFTVTASSDASSLTATYDGGKVQQLKVTMCIPQYGAPMADAIAHATPADRAELLRHLADLVETGADYVTVTATGIASVKASTYERKNGVIVCKRGTDTARAAMACDAITGASKASNPTTALLNIALVDMATAERARITAADVASVKAKLNGMDSATLAAALADCPELLAAAAAMLA